MNSHYLTISRLSQAVTTRQSHMLPPTHTKSKEWCIRDDTPVALVKPVFRNVPNWGKDGRGFPMTNFACVLLFCERMDSSCHDEAFVNLGLVYGL